MKFNSNIYLNPRIIRIRKFSYRLLSEYGNFHTAYSQYTYRFIPRILRMRPNTVISNIRYWIIFIPAYNGILLQKKYVCVQLDRRSKRNNQLFGLARQNNFFPRILIIRGMTFEFEYLGDFEFIFENSLGSWSGDQELAFDKKNECRKSRASVPLKEGRVLQSFL